MIHLHINQDYTIAVASKFKREGYVSIAKSELPDDFYKTFSKQKYLYKDGAIAVNPLWLESEGEAVQLPDDLPHRELIIEAGITSLQELQRVEDLTSLKGIGVVKAGEITTYLTTNKQ